MPQAIFGAPINSILLVKLDHLGDFVVALPALRRIRAGFPNALITLVCGPWNQKLAQETGLFDDVRAFSFFNEQTRHDFRQKRDPKWLVAMHQEFSRVAGGPYDLAVDLRYDTDSRRLLTMIDAKHRAGIGDFAEFPFLDLAIPSDRHEAHRVESEGVARQVQVNFQPDGAPVYLEPGRKDLRLEFAVDEPTPPIEIGSSPADHRKLGIALLRAKVTRRNVATGMFPGNHFIWEDPASDLASEAYGLEEVIDFSAQSRRRFGLGAGWSDAEPFGVWNEGFLSSLSIPVAVGLHRGLKLCLLLRGNTGAAMPRQSFALSCGGRRISRAVIEGSHNERTLVVRLPHDLIEEAPTEIVSEEFFVDHGPCSLQTVLDAVGTLDASGSSSISFEVVNAVGRTLGRQTLAGAHMRALAANDIEFFQSDPGIGLRVRVRVCGKPFTRGILCRHLRIVSVPRKYSATMHQYDWCALVADAVVRRFALSSDLIGLPSRPLPPPLQKRLDEHYQAGEAVIVVATGSGKDVTMWPLRYYSALIGMLLAASRCAVYLIGSAHESADAEQIIADNHSSPSIVNICGETSIPQLNTLLKSANLFIGNSTGTAHLAAMSGVPTLSLHSGTNDVNQWGPIGTKAVCLSLAVPCRRCHIIDLSQCSHRYRCMLDLTPPIVFQQARAMLLEAPARLHVAYVSKVNA